jgi:hypothetical protein
MKRRARLRPRGASASGGDPQWVLEALDDLLHRRDDGGVVLAAERPRQVGVGVGLDRDGSGDRRLGLGGGIAVDRAVTAGVARVPTDHRRELRALRTARARRLAIALGLVRAVRLE